MKIQIIKNKNINDYITWSIWSCEISSFDWEYSDEEHCFIIRGEAIISYNSHYITISKGDYLIFPKGMKCYWKITQKIKKYYKFK